MPVIPRSAAPRACHKLRPDRRSCRWQSRRPGPPRRRCDRACRVLIGFIACCPGNGQPSRRITPCCGPTFHHWRQQQEQVLRQQGVAIPAALAALDPEQHALTVDVGDLQHRHFGHAKTRTIGDRPCGLVLQAGGGVKEASDLVAAEQQLARVLERACAPDRDNRPYAGVAVSGDRQGISPGVGYRGDGCAASPLRNAACSCPRSAFGAAELNRSWSGALLKKPVMVCSHRATLNADAGMVLDRFANRERPPAQRVRSPAPSRSFNGAGTTKNR